MVTVDILELVARWAATHCRGTVVVPCELWLVSSSLLGFEVVSEGSQGVGVAVLLDSTATLSRWRGLRAGCLPSLGVPVASGPRPSLSGKQTVKESSLSEFLDFIHQPNVLKFVRKL